MCGIAGIVNLSRTVVADGDIKSMTDKAAHRGPDGFGYYHDKHLALGHRRLSILDLTPAGAQPMHFGDRYVIVFNGEIYNYIEVRDILQSQGYQFQSGSDTEVILAAYDCWKDECVNYFNGMWSFCLYDRNAEQLFCSRDRFGVKPFYYSFTSDTFRFGSEIKQILADGRQSVVNMKVLANYLVLGMEDYDEETFFTNIYKLLPGHNLKFDLKSNTFEIEKYYSIAINKEIESFDLEKSTTLFLNELKRSVTYRLRSDVKVGTCLSGGLDSSMIAAIASDIYSNESSKKFTAITATSSDSANDETIYAKSVAAKSDLDWITTEPSIADFMNSINEVVKAQEEPFGSPSVFMQYFVMKKAAETGCPVLLDGQGGDETLLGYARYFPSYLMSLKGMKKVKGWIHSSKNSGLSQLSILKSYFYFTNASVRMKRQLLRSDFLKKDFLNLVNSRLVANLASTYSDIRKLQIYELTTTQLPHLLRYEDKNSMHFSIETRLPFLDYKLVELSLSLNNDFKIRDGYSKYILRRSSEGVLPPEISWRKNKIGFEAPSSVWLKEKGFMYDAIKKSKLLSSIMETFPDLDSDITLLWRLFNVAKWEEVFDVRQN